MAELTVATGHDSSATAPRHHRAAEAVAGVFGPVGGRWSLPILLAVGVGALSVAVVADVSPIPRSYAAMSTPAAVADLAAGLGLITAGGLAWHDQRRGAIGPLTALIGVAWLATDWVGWADGPAISRSVAMVVAPFLLPLVIHLGVAFPTGGATGRLARRSVAAAYGTASVVSVGWALTRDPYRDRHCWSNCTDNTFLVRAEPELARSLTVLWLVFVLGAGVLLAAAGSWRLGRASRIARRRLAPVIAPVGLAAVTQAVHAGLLLADPAEHPQRPVSTAVFFARAGALVALAAGVIWAVLREMRTRRAVARLADDLGAAPPPGSLRTALARSLGDDGLDVAYWLPGRQIYVDASGQQVDLRPERTQAATQIVRSGQRVAIVIHDRSLEDTHDLEREIGAASRLAVDNERLQAQAMAQLTDLRASRIRIVETSDAARRQLERNLHDGAQQRLLALSYELQLAEADAASGRRHPARRGAVDGRGEGHGRPRRPARISPMASFPSSSRKPASAQHSPRSSTQRRCTYRS